MKKIFIILLIFAVLLGIGTILSDKNALQKDLIRLHVVGNSNSESDQQMKITVKDAVVAYINSILPQAGNAAQAKEILRSHISDIAAVANKVLSASGSTHTVTVSLKKESFNTRQYATFSLPSGKYESLRIQIGAGDGRNWWCVAFPGLCIPATNAEFEDTAVSCGLQDGLVNTLSGERPYKFRFFLLDCLGKLENLLFPD